MPLFVEGEETGITITCQIVAYFFLKFKPFF